MKLYNLQFLKEITTMNLPEENQPVSQLII